MSAPLKLQMVTEVTPNGTLIALVDDFYGVTITRTRSDPWRLGDGTLVVSVVGRTGGYSAERCYVMPLNDGHGGSGWLEHAAQK